MKRTAIVGIAFAIALCGCGRGHVSQQQTVTTPAADARDEAMTIVGCLVPAGETPERRAVGTSGNPPPPSFTLVNATTAAPGSAAGSFRLVADESRLDDLERYSNSRVEVIGSLVSSTGNGADVGTASGPAGAPPDDVRRIRVRDVRRLEPTCGVSKNE